MNEHERLNFYRLSLLIMDGGTPTLKWLFEKQYAASGDLEIFLKSKRTILDDLYKKRKIINQRQMDLLRPSTGIKPSVEQFDTSLLITLLTNICPIQQPLGGWTVFPAASDLCPGADILRVRDARNNLFHHAKCGISDAEFQLESSNVSAAISRLSNQLDQQQQVNIQKIIDDASNAARDFGREKEICNLIFIDKIDEIHNLVQGIYHRGNDGVITGLAVSEAIHSLLEDDKHDGTTDQPDMCFTLGENSIIIVVKLYADLKKELTREIVMSIAKVLFKEDNSTDVLEEIEQASSRRLCIDSLLKRVIHREAATVQSFLKEIHSKCPRMADVLAKTIITEEDCKKFQLIDDRVHANGRISSKVHTRCRIDESDVKFFQRCLYYSPENVDKIADVLLSKLYISFSDHSRVSLQSDVFTRIYVLFEIIRSCHLDSVSELENVLGSELYKEWIIFRNETSGPNGENTGVWQSIIQRIGGAASSLMDSICQTFNIHFIRSERGSLVLIFKAGDNFNIELLKPEAVKMKVRELLEKTCPAHHPLFKDPIHVTVFIKSAQYGEKEEIHFVLEKVRDRKEIEDGHSHFGRHERDYMIEEMDPAPLEKWMFERFKIDECTKIHLEDIISWNDIGRGEKMKILIDTLERFEDGYELMQRYCEENDKFVYDKVFQKGRQQSRTGHNTEVGYDKGEGMQKVFTTWIDFSENPTDAGNPVNILNMDDRSIQLFKNALKDGKEKDYSIRVMVIGHYGVGKTTLIQRLLGKNVNISERHSTEGIDIHLHCCDVSLSSREWTLREKDADQYSRLQRLVRLLNEHSHRQESKREQERQREFDDHVTSVEYDNEHTKQNQHVSKKRNYGHPQQDKHVSAQPGTYQKVNPPSSQPVESPIVRLDPEASSGIDSKNNQKDTVMELLILVKEKSDKVEKHSGEYAALTFWDFSGRYLFYATHQAFLTRRAIYLLVIDFSQQVTDLVDDECYLDAEGIKLCNVHELTEIWLNMIHCCAPSYYYGNPPVILVGTHVDKIPEKNRQKVINEYFIKIRQMLKNKPLVFHLMDNIAIDNTIDNAQRDPRMEHLKRRIFDLASHQPHWGEEKPARWIPLEEAIMKIKASGVKVAPLSLIEEINRSSSVKIEDRYELDVFLHFQHDTGMIVYFNANGLKDMIVLDPQWMFDALKSLITDHRFIEQNPTVTKEWYAFNNKGKLTHELIGLYFESFLFISHNYPVHEKELFSSNYKIYDKKYIFKFSLKTH
ncbi:hypothetical protein ACJMK2_001292 [Sinanodonta woodiana]|uniref:non-specific serine/threonine protein kinase n=1 Tax=Sinanodonta woodiana TaxID=1069815 RepID=A0ABD3XRS5_SINWO